MMNANDVIMHMESLRNERQRRALMGFFKTSSGEYGPRPHAQGRGWDAARDGQARFHGPAAGLPAAMRGGQMHRTTLRYAIEKMEAQERQYWMNHR